MNRISAIALFAAASFATFHSASAQTPLKTNVPFAFTVNDATLPAGTYTVTFLRMNLVRIKSVDQKHSNPVLVAAYGSGEMNPHGASRLVFKEYGGRYFLSEIVSPLDSTDVVIRASKLEKKVRVELAGKSGGEPVEIALK